MSVFFKKALWRIFILLCVFTTISCEKESEIDEITDVTPEEIPYHIPPEHKIYNDSILKQILEEELSLIKQHKNNGSTKNISGMIVDKSNPKKVYVHYLPWFQSKPYDGYWGQHWTMTNRDPNHVNSYGVNDIASYYNPLIGPYSSSDPDLQEYHFLLMKLAGIDGVIFDWYGSRNIHDYGLIKNATETFISQLENVDLDFSIMYEDRVAYMEQPQTIEDPIQRAKEDFSYIKDVYFKSSNYLEFNNSKLISVFGPHYLTSENDWNSIYDIFSETEQPSLISLWAKKNTLGNHFKGEFLWVAPDHLLAQDYYYENYANANEITIGSTYPGFNSFYEEGGWSDGINTWVLPKNNGSTFIQTLNNSGYENANFIQIITWNDFGEGTMIEPTTQFGFKYLSILQEYTGTNYTEDDLATVVRLYQSRKNHADSPIAMQLLDNSYNYIKQLKIERVNMILQAIDRFY
ncbi:glycoside hydrolase family 71/99-like protein [Algibacter sp. L3A6]|uniref:glycoside hydrolase family 71/99-like protein n=1 Tax=Algibacter sp. L3A6 TaxID=2686366 RepID=UPI00131B898A|nr:glycoside hydrolase family 71/99-like protein [Algibacter sp. L3A6]